MHPYIFAWIKMWIFFAHTISIALCTVAAYMHLKIQRSVNIFTISAAAAGGGAAVRFPTLPACLPVCLFVSWNLRSVLVTLYILFLCTIRMNWSMYSYMHSRSFSISFSILLLPWQILISSCFILSICFRHLPIFFLSLYLSRHFFRSQIYCLADLSIMSHFFVSISLALHPHSSIWNRKRMGTVWLIPKRERERREKHFRFVQFSVCVSVRYHLKPNKCTFPVVRFLLRVNSEYSKFS